MKAAVQEWVKAFWTHARLAFRPKQSPVANTHHEILSFPVTIERTQTITKIGLSRASIWTKIKCSMVHSDAFAIVAAFLTTFN